MTNKKVNKLKNGSRWVNVTVRRKTDTDDFFAIIPIMIFVLA